MCVVDFGGYVRFVFIKLEFIRNLCVRFVEFILKLCVVFGIFVSDVLLVDVL